MGLRIKHKGNFNNVDRFLKKMDDPSFFNQILNKFGKIGVDALAIATPIDSGLTAVSWTYEILQENGRTQIIWYNTNENQGVNIAVILQYGHGTGTGGYVQGRDYINPAMRPIFDHMAEEIWREVTNA